MLGIFDSGIGGLSVVKEIFKELPEYQVLYFGDIARFPYGPRSRETIWRYAFEDTTFLTEKGAKIVIVACNTASAAAHDLLKKKFSFPIFEVVTPTVNKAKEKTRNKRIGVIGTRATVESGIYQKLLRKIDRRIKVFSKACPLLIPLVEEGWTAKAETKKIVKRYLQPLKIAKIDTLILGCTHFRFIKDIIQKKIGRKVNLIDPGQEVVLGVKEYLRVNPEVERTISRGKKHHFFVSDLTPKFKEMAQRWLGKKVRLEKIDLGKCLK